MNQISPSRDKFRRLAILEIDPYEILGIDEKVDCLVQAAKTADAIFWRQVLPGTDSVAVLRQAGNDNELKEMLLFNYGPYDALNGDAPLLPVPKKAPGAGFYPRDLTPAEFLGYIQSHKDASAALQSPYTIVRRTNGYLRAIPFHEAYGELVNKLASLLDQAAVLENHLGFRQFLTQRARDIRADDFYSSDALWVNLTDNPIDLVIGPYEVYQDELLGLKAAYEALVLKRNFEETAKVQHYQHELTDLCTSLQREVGRPLLIGGQRVKMSVADLGYASGDAHKAIPAIAFNLPNDERVIEELGARQVILKNVLEAKFRLVGWKILKRVLREPPEDKDWAFQRFFTFILFHEIAHSVGPHRITKDGEHTTVNRCLRQHYTVLEEAKADTLGACLTLTAAESDAATFLQTYVGGLLRPIRFGAADAHGGANTIQFNYLLQHRAIIVNAVTGKLTIDPDAVRRTLCKLVASILDIQERGDFAAADHMISTFRGIGSDLRMLIKSTEDLPVDIRIRFVAHSNRSIRRRRDVERTHLTPRRTEVEPSRS
jgi:hypothetical protein